MNENVDESSDHECYHEPKQTKSTTPPANPLSWIEVIVKRIKAIEAKIAYLGRKYLL